MRIMNINNSTNQQSRPKFTAVIANPEQYASLSNPLQLLSSLKHLKDIKTPTGKDLMMTFAQENQLKTLTKQYFLLNSKDGTGPIYVGSFNFHDNQKMSTFYNAALKAITNLAATITGN